MSNISLFEQTKSLVLKQEVTFVEMAKIHGAIDFKREASFALQYLQDNAFLLKTAVENPDSLKRAILNVAAIGLTLSPVYKYAYLVPRDGKVMLDLSYKGLSQLAIDVRAIKYVIAELVYSNDKFLLKGRGQEPIHEFNPFDENRGNLIGAYCVAKTYNDEFLVTTMASKEILEIRDRTQAYKAFLEKKIKTCPWVTDVGEMFKKTVIRRASKSWPMVDTREGERFAKAINVFDEADPVESNSAPQLTSTNIEAKKEIAEIKSLIEELGKSEIKFLEHVSRVSKREIRSFDDLTDIEVEKSLTMLYQMRAEAVKSLEAKSENA